MRPQDQAAAEEPAVAAPTRNRWPPQVKFIVGNEACERFSYYGMKGILALYITLVLLKTEDDATNIIALFSAANYFMPMLGAWVSDRYWGRYNTILWISLSYCAGHAVLATSDFIPTVGGKTLALYLGLGLIAFGSGGIKPCVSAFMGDQFRPDQRHLLQKAYAAFYWSINLGSFFSFFAIPFIRKQWGYSWAFGVPGVFMAVATFIFWLGTKYYLRVPPTRETKAAGFMQVFMAGYREQQGGGLVPLLNLLTTIGLPLVAMAALTVVALMHEMTPAVRCVNWLALVCVSLWYVLIVAGSLLGKSELSESFWLAARKRHTEGEVTAARSVSPLLFVFALIPIFWALFDQTFSTWVLQGEKMKSCFVSADARFSKGDIRDAQSLAAKLTAGTNAGYEFVWSQLPPEAKAAVTNAALPAAARAEALANGLNQLITSSNSLYDKERFASARLSSDAEILMDSVSAPNEKSRAAMAVAAGAGTGKMARLNRLLLEDLFPDEVAKLYRIGPEEMLSANPLLVMILLPVMTWGLYPLMGRLATPLRRMSSGMFLGAFSYVIVAMLQSRIEHGVHPSILWQTVPYIIITIAEVLVSTTGLEFAFREAAPAMKSIVMGFWNLTITMGNLMVVGITKALPGTGANANNASVSTTRFLMYAGLTFVVAILFSVIAAHYQYRDKTAAEGK